MLLEEKKKKKGKRDLVSAQKKEADLVFRGLM